MADLGFKENVLRLMAAGEYRYLVSLPWVHFFLDRMAEADGNQTLWDFMGSLSPPKEYSSQVAPGEVRYIEPMLTVNWRGVGRVKASKAYKFSGGVDINSLALMRPGVGEVNDHKRLHSRKDWVVGFLEPFPRTEEGKAAWKVTSFLSFILPSLRPIDFIL